MCYLPIAQFLIHTNEPSNSLASFLCLSISLFLVLALKMNGIHWRIECNEADYNKKKEWVNVNNSEKYFFSQNL